MEKHNGHEQITTADRNAVGYEMSAVNTAETNRALNRFLDDRGLGRGQLRSGYPARRKPVAVAAQVVETPAQETLVATPEPEPEPRPAPLPAEPVATNDEPAPVTLADAIAALQQAAFEYAFLKATDMPGSQTLEAVTLRAERIVARFKLPEEVL